MNGLKKTFAIVAAASLVCLSSAGAMAASKLIVKGTDGTTDKFVVTDTGYTGIGTSTPTYGLQIVGSNGNATGLAVINDGGASYNAANSGGFQFIRNNPSGTNTGLPQSGDRLGYFTFGALSAGAAKNMALVGGFADGTWTATSFPTSVRFETTPSGGIARLERMRINASGNVGIGTTAPAQKLDVSGGIRLNSTGAQPTCDASNRGTFWVIQGTTDVLQICAQVSGGYAWHGITLN
jgi:hypothetical protein